jgi:hypothetical protein
MVFSLTPAPAHPSTFRALGAPRFAWPPFSIFHYQLSTVFLSFLTLFQAHGSSPVFPRGGNVPTFALSILRLRYRLTWGRPP